MKYGDIKEWLNGRAEDYDFVEDTQDDPKGKADFGKIKNVYERFLIYQYRCQPHLMSDVEAMLESLDCKKKNKLISGLAEFLEKADSYIVFDPDDREHASPLLQEVYGKIWCEMIREGMERGFMKNGSRIASDTMTSAMTRFTDAMMAARITKILEALVGAEPLTPAGIAEKVQELAESDAYRDLFDGEDMEKVVKMIWKICCVCKAFGAKAQPWWTAKFSITVIALLGKGERKVFYRWIDKDYPCMRRFLEKAHHIGNYCPVPRYFNSARTGIEYNGEYDYWDLTLMKIKDWYDGKADALHQLLHVKNEKSQPPKLINCREWLKCFGSWRGFVNALYLQDYVDKAYKVKPLWTKHGWGRDEYIGLPEGTEAINDGLREICNRITLRSVRIVMACCEKESEGRG